MMPNSFADSPCVSTSVLSNNHLHLVYLTHGGLRISALELADAPGNVLIEAPAAHWPTPYGEYFLIGGHRLWHAPEIAARTYVPDAAELAVEPLPDGVRLTAPVEAPTGIGKSLEIHLHPDLPAVTVIHGLRNAGLWPVELAPWAITALPLGGTMILPQPAAAPGSFLPNRQLVLWPYTRWQDTRLHLNDDMISLEARPALPPCKIGYFNTSGWVGYLRQGVLLLKRFTVQAERPHVDRGCNVEVYCNDHLAELETLGPLERIEPGQTVFHRETWELHRVPAGENALETVGHIEPLLP